MVSEKSDKDNNASESERTASERFNTPLVNQRAPRYQKGHYAAGDASLTNKCHSLSDEFYWSDARRYASEIIDSPLFMALMTGVVICNIGVVVYETDLRASGQEVPIQAFVISLLMLVAYAGESALRLYVDHLGFFHERWNVFDLSIVCVDTILVILDSAVGNLPSVSVLKLLRLMRIVRIIRAFKSCRELFLMLNGLASAMLAIFWATLLIMLTLLIWSLVGVELVHPIMSDLADQGGFRDCARCTVAFSSVWKAMVTLIQTVLAGDSWGDIAVPALDEYPLSMLFFIGSWVSVNLGIMNLIVAVIVDKAAEARDNDAQFRLIEKESQQKQITEKMKTLFAEIDQDGDRTLTFEELEQGASNSAEFAGILRFMDITHDELRTVFDIIDRDQSGTVSQSEFSEQLVKMKSQDSHTLLMMIRQKLNTLEDKVDCVAEGKEYRTSHHNHDHRDRISVFSNLSSSRSIPAGGYSSTSSREAKLANSNAEQETQKEAERLIIDAQAMQADMDSLIAGLHMKFRNVTDDLRASLIDTLEEYGISSHAKMSRKASKGRKGESRVASGESTPTRFLEPPERSATGAQASNEQSVTSFEWCAPGALPEGHGQDHPAAESESPEIVRATATAETFDGVLTTCEHRIQHQSRTQ